MELNEGTMQVLKNFAQINPNLVINPGTEIKTMAEAKNVLATAVVSDEFTTQMGIYDLNEFLSVLGLVTDPELTADEKVATISDASGRSKIKYYFSDVSMLTQSTKTVTMPSKDVTFNLDQETLTRLTRAAGAMGHNEISITPNNGAISLTVCDHENPTSNTFAIDVPGSLEEDTTFAFYLSVSNLKKLVSGSYTVQLSSKCISHFQLIENPLFKMDYFIALEKHSKYGA